MRPGVTVGASLDARISISDAWNDEMDLAGQIQTNSDCTNDLVANDIAIPLQSDQVVELWIMVILLYGAQLIQLLVVMI